MDAPRLLIPHPVDAIFVTRLTDFCDRDRDCYWLLVTRFVITIGWPPVRLVCHSDRWPIFGLIKYQPPHMFTSSSKPPTNTNTNTRKLYSAKRTSWRRWPKTRATHRCHERSRCRSMSSIGLTIHRFGTAQFMVRFTWRKICRSVEKSFPLKPGLCPLSELFVSICFGVVIFSFWFLPPNHAAL